MRLVRWKLTGQSLLRVDFMSGGTSSKGSVGKLSLIMWSGQALLLTRQDFLSTNFGRNWKSQIVRSCESSNLWIGRELIKDGASQLGAVRHGTDLLHCCSNAMQCNAMVHYCSAPTVAQPFSRHRWILFALQQTAFTFCLWPIDALRRTGQVLSIASVA